MSHQHENQSAYSLGGLISTIFYVLFAISLIVMLGVVGAAFIRSGGYKPNPVQAAASMVPTVPAAGSPAAPAGSTHAVDTAQMEEGKSLFMVCSACHGPDGKGMPMGPLKMAPPLAGSKILAGNPEAAVSAVLKGIKKENNDFVQIMVPLPLDDQKIAAVLTYVRNSFGNSAPAVTKEFVAEIRAKRAASADPLTRAEVEKLAAQK